MADALAADADNALLLRTTAALARAWRARRSGSVGARGLGLTVFSVLYVVLCWAALDA